MQTNGVAAMAFTDVAFFVPPGRPQRPGRRSTTQRRPSFIERVRRARASATRRIARTRQHRH